MWLLSTPSSSPPVQPQFDFQGHAHFGHARQVLRADLDVFVQGLFRQVDHVGREQRFASSGEVFFTGVQQAVDPRSSFFAQWSVCRITGTP
ncbi:Uncharacterised protein [Klebsiella pneumoniae]|nr:Uncharacterised protein [Klebsiella pneumoniae]